MLRNSRRYLVLALALLAAAFFIYKFRHAITLEGFRWSMVADSLHQARPSLLLFGVVAIYACFALRALRWMRFSRVLGKSHFGNVYAGTLMGFACVFLLGRAGEPIRPVLIARKDSLSIPGMFGVWVLERLFDIAASAVLAGFALLAFERHGFTGLEHNVLMKTARSAGMFLLAAIVAAIAFLIYFRYHGSGQLARKLHAPDWRRGWRGRIVHVLDGFSAGLQGIRTWADLGVLLFYTAVHWLLVALVYLWVIRAFPGRLAGFGLRSAMLVLAFGLVGSALQLPGVGGGMQLATFLVLTLIFGVEKEPAATVSIMIWLVTFASCSLVGLPLLFREGWSMGELRRIARSEERAAETEFLHEAEPTARTPESPSSSRKVSLP